MEGLESQPAPRKEQKEVIDSERVQLTEKCLQAYYAKLENKTDEEGAKAILNVRQFFREWFKSQQGLFLINMYTQSHTEEETRAFKDMEQLAEEFEAYHSRKTETLH